MQEQSWYIREAPVRQRQPACLLPASAQAVRRRGRSGSRSTASRRADMASAGMTPKARPAMVLRVVTHQDHGRFKCYHSAAASCPRGKWLSMSSAICASLICNPRGSREIGAISSRRMSVVRSESTRVAGAVNV